MSGYAAGIDQLRHSAAAATSVGEQASQIDLGAGVDGVAAGLPGSASASLAAELAGAWDERLGTWTADLREFGTSVSAAADGYAASDETAAEAFSASRWERASPWF